MSNFVYLLILFVVVIVLVILRMPKRKKSPLTFPYQSKEFLISPAERSLLGVLDQVLSNGHYRVFAQVRLADVVEVAKGLQRAAWQRAFNTISRKHLDFVVCRSDDMALMGAIELDDESHEQGKRKERDQVVDKILEAAGIPLVRIRADSAYAPTEIKNILSTEMGLKLSDDYLTQGLHDVEPEKSADNTSEESADSPHLNQDKGPTCPKCGSSLVARVAQKGKYKGQKFWGCSQFPRCKYVAKRG